MTSKLTITDDKLSALLSEMERSLTGCQGHGYIDAAEEYGDMISALRELQERRKADSEPVAYADPMAFVNFEAGNARREWMWKNPGADLVPLYRHAQPAHAVTFYRDGIEAAAKWIDQQREAYDSEHGWSDPDTGTFEFGNDAQRGYSSTLEELAEGIRALHPNAGNSPVIPDGYVMVPIEPTEAMMLHKSGCQHHAWDDPDCAMRQTRQLVWSLMIAAATQEVK